MNNLFELNTVDDILIENFADSDSFKEFSYNLSILDRLYVDPLMEEVIDHENTFKRKASNIIKNTKDTTTGVVKVYDQVTDANANLIKSTWDLIMKGIGLLTKITTFIVNQIAKIPKFIINVLNKVMKLPSNIRNKIQGNIELYITANDIENLYNQSLLSRIDSFIHYAEELSKGQMWNAVFGAHIKLKDGFPIKWNSNDITCCKEMKKIYKNLVNMEFTQTTIYMNNQSVINTYFGNDESITYVWNGRSHTSNYYNALVDLIKNLDSQKDSIKKIQESINIKLNESYANSNFVNLTPKAQAYIKEAIQEIAKVTGIIGNFIKYITHDMKTISDTADAIINKSTKTAKKLSKNKS